MLHVSHMRSLTPVESRIRYILTPRQLAEILQGSQIEKQSPADLPIHLQEIIDFSQKRAQKSHETVHTPVSLSLKVHVII